MTIRAVALDGFGTLISFGQRRLNPYSRLLSPTRDYGAMRLPFLTRNVPVDVFAEETGMPHVLPDLRRDLGVEIAGLRTFDEVPEVLGRLRTGGFRIAVCSNLAYEYGEPLRRLVPDLNAYVFSYEQGVAKPDPAIYTATCEALDVEAHEVLFVGDSRLCDFTGPTAFGMQAKWLDRRGGMTLRTALSDVLRD